MLQTVTRSDPWTGRRKEEIRNNNYWIMTCSAAQQLAFTGHACRRSATAALLQCHMNDTHVTLQGCSRMQHTTHNGQRHHKLAQV